MGDKLSHRRKNIKQRDPMALALESNLFHQRKVEPKKKETRWDRKDWYDNEESD